MSGYVVLRNVASPYVSLHQLTERWLRYVDYVTLRYFTSRYVTSYYVISVIQFHYLPHPFCPILSVVLKITPLWVTVGHCQSIAGVCYRGYIVHRVVTRPTTCRTKYILEGVLYIQFEIALICVTLRCITLRYATFKFNFIYFVTNMHTILT